MSTPALFLLFLHVSLFPATLQQGTLPPKALNPERLQVMKDALSWMTFRKDGKLATDQDLAPFLESLRVNYTNSKYFRTLIVAFRDGVLPRLTLNENDGCDPAYTVEYRDPYNNSVTYGYLKKFIFEYYDNGDESSPKFCDYRQGLVCNQQTRRCGCPKGSKMEPISAGSSVQRCQMEENEICALIDLDHDPTTNYGALKRVLPEMLFNLEKPLSCKMGTQCRFKSNAQNSPSCYSNNNGGSWAKGRWGLDFGEQCTLGLYAETGPCQGKSSIGVLPGYTCYNFGPLKPPVPAQVGICVHDVGSYGIASSSIIGPGHWNWNPLFIGMVSPATTSLRGRVFRDFVIKFLRQVYPPYVHYGYQSTHTDEVNGSCNVAKTEEVLENWKFFLNLDASPPPTQDHVATEAELQNKLQKLVDLAVDWSKKTCKVYTNFNGHWYKSALRCIADGAFVDANGNDGRCESVPEDEDVTVAYARKFRAVRENIEDIGYDQWREDDKHRRDMLGSVEVECDPELGKPPGSEGAPKTEPSDNDVLEGGYCPPDRGCYTNYGDYLNLYDSDCDWEYDSVLNRDCQWLDEGRKFGKCEERKLNEKIKEELTKISSSNGLGRGDSCDYYFEQKIRKGIQHRKNYVDGNKYQVLWQIQNARYKVGGAGLCDRTRMLECTEEGTCECMGGTATRNVTIEGVEYMSDYCYVTSGNCGEYRLSTVYNVNECSKGEKEDILKHYKAKNRLWQCEGSNWCVYVSGNDDNPCTTKNTGHTGFPPEPEPATDKPGSGSGSSCGDDDPYCDYEDAGKGENQLDQSLKMIIIIVMMITIKKVYQ